MNAYDQAIIAWNTYLKDTYVNYKGETKPTFASKWRTSNPNLARQIQAYRDRKGLRPHSTDGYAPMVITVVDLLLATEPDDEPPPPPIIAPRTFNPEGGSDAQYCVRDLPRDPNRGNLPYDVYTHYDNNGKDVDGGRDKNYMSRWPDGTLLRGARTTDGLDNCVPYDGHTEWGPDSYTR